MYDFNSSLPIPCVDYREEIHTIVIGDGQNREDLTVYNIGGSNFFRLRDLGTALGFEVGYDALANTATVRSK